MTDVDARTSSPVADDGGGTAAAQLRRGTLLNHTGFVYRPGETSLVIELFEALNCRCEQDDSPEFGKYVIVRMGSRPGVNDFFAAEAEPEHLALEEALRRQIDTD